MKPILLIAVEIPPDLLAGLGTEYETRYAPTPAETASVIAVDGGTVRAVLTNGSVGVSVANMTAMPKLEIVCCRGAGHENVDLAVARTRGIVVTHGPATNDCSVADHAMALVLAVARGIPAADAGVRAGGWSALRAPRPQISGRCLGILGMGRIGRRIAQRGAGFDMEVVYHNRSPVEGAPYRYLGSALALALAADILVVVCPGGSATRHLVNGPVLDALGPGGFVVNVGRGTVIETAALVVALREGRIAGAGLDVFEGEPGVPDVLFDTPNCVLTPHLGGRSPEAVAASAKLLLDNLRAHFSGKSVLTPVS